MCIPCVQVSLLIVGIFILCHSLRWIPNIWELKHSGLKKVGRGPCSVCPGKNDESIMKYIFLCGFSAFYSTICYENLVWLCWWEGFELAALSVQWVAWLLHSSHHWSFSSSVNSSQAGDMYETFYYSAVSMIPRSKMSHFGIVLNQAERCPGQISHTERVNILI